MAEAVIVKLEIKDRTEGKNPRQLRAEGNLPITVYGKDLNITAQVDSHEFKLSYRNNKDSKFELTYNGKTYSTVVKNVQINSATNEVQNVEFALA